jgi:SAM-dependent methyltransferase
VNTRYDTIGRTYATTRRTEPRIAARIHDALGDAQRVVNVGAGTGNYEPEDRAVVAIDPSITMLRQRAKTAARAVLGAAEALPFADGAFDAAMTTLTLHHWTDLDIGLREMRRVAPRQVIFFFDAACTTDLWLVDDYFPEIVELPTERAAPDASAIARVLDVRSVEPIPVPADCIDGFGGSYWNRPEAYLDPVVQAGMSSFAQLDREVLARGIERLRRDLESGAWDDRLGHLREMHEIDLGYRLLVAGLP